MRMISTWDFMDSKAWARRNLGVHLVWLLALTAASTLILTAGARAAADKIQTAFRIKFAHENSVYLEGGANAGLLTGQKLTVQRNGEGESEEKAKVIAEIEIDSVASVSAVGRIISANDKVVPGDLAYLSSEDVARLKAQQTEEERKSYPQVITFTQPDPPEQETRESLPKPQSPAVNRIRGRIGLDYSSLQTPGGGIGSSQFGYLVRIEATRLGNTYWNISGYHRGRFQSRTGGIPQETLTDLINRTYHLSLTYANPNSHWVAGFGRMYIPWASSLSTIDGFYLGRRRGRMTMGAFGGSTPDPTSWNYDRHRQLAGVFTNFEGGTFENFRYSSTAGVALSRIQWHPDRQFGFFENNLFFKRYVSLYSDIECDLRLASQNGGSQKVELSRSYFTLRLQPHRILSLDFSEDYFRNIPTFDVRLISTGLLDPFLFQGVSAGFTLDLPHLVGIFSSAGRSSRSRDGNASWNYLAGIVARDILRTGIRADFRYSKFDSSFGHGNYQTIQVSRNIRESLRFDIQVGQQNIISAFTSSTRARFVNGTVDWDFGSHFALGAGFTAYRAQAQDYNQYYVLLGYRFDIRHLGAQRIH
jgi:hypothetical protein